MNDTYSVIEAAIHYMANYQHQQPSLSQVAASVNMSDFHFQRVFTQWAGISPKRFLQYLTKEHAKSMLRESSVLDAAIGVGLSGSGRLHDLLINTEAVTPGQFRNKGAGITIRYGIHPSPFGEALIGITERGVCFLGFILSRAGDAMRELRSDWPMAELVEDQRSTSATGSAIFGSVADRSGLSVHLCGTNFQLKVWEALMRIPVGGAVSYKGIAQSLGNPRAVQAVGSAVGRNSIAYLIPCHRVIREIGEFGEYRYGADRKRAILGWEQGHSAGLDALDFEI